MKNEMNAELSPPQQSLVDCYRKLATVLREHGDELAPLPRKQSRAGCGSPTHFDERQVETVLSGIEREPDAFLIHGLDGRCRDQSHRHALTDGHDESVRNPALDLNRSHHRVGSERFSHGVQVTPNRGLGPDTSRLEHFRAREVA